MADQAPHFDIGHSASLALGMDPNGQPSSGRNAEPGTSVRGSHSVRSFVERQRLIDVLDSVPAGGVGTVTASAGWGKSVLLERWASLGARDGTPVRPAVALLRLGSRTRDQAVLARRLLEAIASVAPGIGDAMGELAAPGTGRLGSAFVLELLDRLDGLDEPLDVVLDDAHTIGGPEGAIDDLRLLVDNLPSHVRIILGSRWDLDVDLHRLRVDQRLSELRAVDLAFTEPEASDFIRAVARVDIDATDVSVLVQRTDGWAAGLQLAALSIQKTDDPRDFIRNFDGTNELVASYLTREVLDRQKPEVRDFLLQSAVLPWLSADLCAAATDSPDLAAAHAALEYLRSHSLFLTPMEPSGHRLRFHQLFADLLRYQLALEDPEAMSAVRRRAATWLEQNGWQADAGEELVTIGEPTKVLEFVRRHGADFFARNESSTLLRWLDGIASAEGPTDLLIDQLAAEMATHQTARVRMSHRLLTARSDLHSGQLAAVEALYSCAGLDDLPTEEVERAVAATRQQLETALGEGEQVPDFLGIGGPGTAEAMASYMGGLASFHSGDLLQATEQLRDTLTLEGMSYPLWKTSALSTLALVRAWSGWYEHAITDARAALELAASAASPHHHAVTHAYLALAATSLDRFEIELATEHLTEAGICVQRSGWAVDRALHQMLSEKLARVGDGPSPAPELPTPAVPPATLPLIIECSLAVNRAMQLARTGSITAARGQLALCPEGPQRWAGEVDIALLSGEVNVARDRLATWRPASRILRDQVGHAIRTAVVESAAGRSGLALHTMSEALRQAEPEGLRAVFTEVPGALDLIRSELDAMRSDFVMSLVESPTGGGVPSMDGERPSELLTSREAELLPYLPTRLTNAEIADRLFVSVNTVKTHLRHIYWKLDVENRDAAVARAEELGLL